MANSGIKLKIRFLNLTYKNSSSKSKPGLITE